MQKIHSLQAALFAVAATVMFAGCGKKPQNSEFNSTIRVNAIEMGQADDTQCRTYVGAIESDMQMQLSFPLGGRLTALYVHNGQRVKKGTLLGKVDDTSAKSLHDAALATLRQAEDGYDRMKQVYDEGGVSEVRWMQMQTDLEKARQSEISTRKHLTDCSLYAPQDGVISMDDHQIGEEMSPMSPLCKLLDMKSLHVLFSVPEQEIELVEEGEAGTVTLPSAPDKTLRVKVSDKGLLANPMGHTYHVKAHITDADGASLMVGQVAKVHLRSTAPSGLIVPSWCVQTKEDGLVVWTIRGGKAYRTHIEVETYVKNGVMVRSGLQPGDQVITDGYQKLYEGADVEVIDVL